MRVDRTPDERREHQAGQIRDRVHRDSGALMEVDVPRVYATDDVEQGDRAAVALVIDRLGQEDRVGDLQAGLLAYFANHGFLNGLAVLDRTAEPRPAVRVRDPRLVVAVVEEQSAVLGHDQQHRRPSLRPRVCVQ
jgi:hypothetical protein